MLRRLLVSQKKFIFVSGSTLKRISWLYIYRTLFNQISSQTRPEKGKTQNLQNCCCHINYLWGKKIMIIMWFKLDQIRFLIWSLNPRKWSGSMYILKSPCFRNQSKIFPFAEKRRWLCLNLWWTGFTNSSKIQQFQLFIRISFQAIEEPFPYRIWSAA